MKTAAPPRDADKSTRPAPIIWYLLWAAVWVSSTAAYALRDSVPDSLTTMIRVFGLILIFIAMYIRESRKFFLGALGFTVAATLLVLVLHPHEMSSPKFIPLLGNAAVLVPLYTEALRSRGVEWQIAKDSALPALGLLMLGGLVYFVLEEVADFPPLTAEWIWLLGGTLWIVSAAFIARRYV